VRALERIRRRAMTTDDTRGPGAAKRGTVNMSNERTYCVEFDDNCFTVIRVRASSVQEAKSKARKAYANIGTDPQCPFKTVWARDC
jgi:hypothetical protein